MTHGSIFSGIGGFDLAATWIGWDNVFNCERDPFCRRVLRYYWPETKSYEDIKKLDASPYRGVVQVLSGGFPCQPFSLAGARKGTADNRYLWPEMLRIVEEIQPRWVVGENVFGLLNWNRGMVFRQVLSDLETAGYEVWPYVLPACGVGAPHRRNRIFFVAHANSLAGDRGTGDRPRQSIIDRQNSGGQKKTNFSSRLSAQGPATDPHSDNDLGKGGAMGGPQDETTSDRAESRGKGESDPPGRLTPDPNGEQRFEGRLYQEQSGKADGNTGRFHARSARKPWENFPSEPPLCGGNDGIPRELDRITFSAWRKESLKAYGNAIVPQVALQIFRSIERIETTDSNYLKST